MEAVQIGSRWEATSELATVWEDVYEQIIAPHFGWHRKVDPVLHRLIDQVHALALGTIEKAAPHVRLMAGCELLDEKGVRGGLGVVYRARHPVLKDLRAIKRPRKLAQADRAQMLGALPPFYPSSSISPVGYSSRMTSAIRPMGSTLHRPAESN